MAGCTAIKEGDSGGKRDGERKREREREMYHREEVGLSLAITQGPGRGGEGMGPSSS